MRENLESYSVLSFVLLFYRFGAFYTMNNRKIKKSQIKTRKSKIISIRFLCRSIEQLANPCPVRFNQLHRRCYVAYCRAIEARKTLITVFEASNLFPDLHPELVFVQVLIHQQILRLIENSIRIFNLKF